MFERLKDTYWRTDQRKALDQLQDPSHFPGLISCKGLVSPIQLHVRPSFQPMMSWTIYHLPDHAYRVRRVRWDFAADYRVELGEPTTFGSDAICSGDTISSALQALSQLTVPAFDHSSSLGTDGVTFGFRRQTFSQFLEFSWWCAPPAGCEAMAEWYHRFTDTLEALLPAHTDQLRLNALRSGTRLKPNLAS